MISIETQLYNIMDLIKKLNLKEKNNFIYGTDALHDVTKCADLSLRDRAKNMLTRLKEQARGRSIDE